MKMMEGYAGDWAASRSWDTVAGQGVIAVMVDPGQPELSSGVLVEARCLARRAQARLTVLSPLAPSRADQRFRGADTVILVKGATAAERFAAEFSGWASDMAPRAVMAAESAWAHEVALLMARELDVVVNRDAVPLLNGAEPAYGGTVGRRRCTVGLGQAGSLLPVALMRAPSVVASPADILPDPLVITVRSLDVPCWDRARGAESWQ